MNKKELIIKKDILLSELIALNTTKKNLTKQFLEKRNEVEKAKKRIDLEPELKQILEEFQRKEQEKLVGVNQNLLTAILQDVIKNDNEERKVVLDIFTERGMPALGIYIEKNNQGVLEDVYNGTGGAVANILSLGLRSIALIQSKKRRFLILDEGDCWIKPEIIPDFIQVIKQLSEKLHIQILVISHHDESLLQGIEHRLILEKDYTTNKIKTSWSNGDIPIWEEKDEGIRSIYLENFQSHSSTYIPLSKTVTLLTGVNDLGKSTIVNALRAVFYGQADDTNIKHFEEQTKVSVDFGDKTLFWERKLKGKPKEIYTLIDQDNGFENPLHKTESARETPEWLEKETGIGLIDGFDIQLGHQKKPVFLLDEPASKKAKALSIGDESNYVQKMINNSKEDLTLSRSIVKKGEEEMEKCYRLLRIYEKYNDKFLDLENKITEVYNEMINILEQNEKFLFIQQEIKRLENTKNLIVKFQNNLLENKKNEENLELNYNNLNNISISLLKNNLLNYLRSSLLTNEKFEKIKKDYNKEMDFQIKQLDVKNIMSVVNLYQKYNLFNIYEEKNKDLFHFNSLKENLENNINMLFKPFSKNEINKINLNFNNIKLLQKLNKIEDIKSKIDEENNLLNFQIDKEKINVKIINIFINKKNEKNEINEKTKLVSNEIKENNFKIKSFNICPLCEQHIEHQHHNNK